MQSTGLFSYAIAVFESIWPKFPEENKLVRREDGAPVPTNAFQLDEKQNEYSGYFKLIPLNLLSVDTTSTKQGHTFRISLDASLVYLQGNPKDFPAEVGRYIRQNALSVPKDDELNLLLGVLEGLSAYELRSDPEMVGFVLPGAIVSQLIHEMDTVTLFLVNDLDIFDPQILLKIAGGNFSRREEYTSTERGRQLLKIGVLPNEFKANDNRFGYAVGVLKQFLTAGGLYPNLSAGVAGGAAFRAVDPSFPENTKEALKKLELQGIEDILTALKGRGTRTPSNLSEPQASPGVNEATVRNVFGPVISNHYRYILESNPKAAIALKKVIQEYYSEGNPISGLISWSLYESIRIRLNEFFNDAFTSGSAINRQDASLSTTEAIILAAALDIVMTRELAQQSLALNTAINTEDKNLIELISRVKQRQKREYSREAYVTGVYLLFNHVKKLVEQEQLERREQALRVINSLKIGLQNSEAIAEALLPISGHTPYFVLKGHVTGVSVSSGVNSAEYQKVISISGEGFELPLKRHNIFFDQINRERSLFKTFLNYGISNQTPIDAAMSLMKTFASDYVDVEDMKDKKNRAATETNIRATRGFDIYQQLSLPSGSSNSLLGKVVNNGNIVFPGFNANETTAMIFTPIHYISLAYLENILKIFNEVGLAEKTRNAMMRNVPEGPLYNALNAVLGQSSAYSWFVDEFGYLKVRYEPSAVSSPYSSVLSPFVTDREIISFRTGTEEGQLYTLVEVSPTAYSLQGPNEGKLLGIFGRAVSPPVDSENRMYDVVSLDPKNEKVINFFKDTLKVFNEELVKAFREHREQVGAKTLEVPAELYNSPTYRDHIRPFLLGESREIVISVQEGTPQERARLEQPPAQAPNRGSTGEGDPCDDPPPPPVTTNPTPVTPSPQPAKQERQKVQASIFPTSKKPLETLFAAAFSPTTNRIVGLVQNADFRTGNLSEEEVLLFRVALLDGFPSPNNYDRAVQNLNSFIKSRYTNSNVFGTGTFVDFTAVGLYYFAQLLTTLMVLGVSPRTVEGLFQGTDEHSRLVQLLIRSSRLRVNPRPLDPAASTDAPLVVREKKPYRIPLKGYALQDTLPSNTSPDLYRYGLRIHRMDDNYLATIQFTRFRAEFFRRLHDAPMRTAQVNILGNPLYKVGSTVLVINEQIEETRNNFVNKGALSSLTELYGYRFDPLLLKVDDLIEKQNRGYKVSCKHPWFSKEDLTRESIFFHFKQAYNFILSASEGRPVPVGAYVPLLGIYNNPSKKVQRYLRNLVRANIQSNTNSSAYLSVLNELEASLVEVLAEYQSADYDIHLLTQLLQPQTFHAYQYNIEAVNHKWTFGEGYTTSLNLTYGLPASVTYIPHIDENGVLKRHYVGYLLNKTPHRIYNDQGNLTTSSGPGGGTNAGDVTPQHPLYQFSFQQFMEERDFYGSSNRKTVADFLEIIRRKYLYPKIYHTTG